MDVNEQLKDRQRATWTAGDFPEIAKRIEQQYGVRILDELAELQLR